MKRRHLGRREEGKYNTKEKRKRKEKKIKQKVFRKREREEEENNTLRTGCFSTSNKQRKKKKINIFIQTNKFTLPHKSKNIHKNPKKIAQLKSEGDRESEGLCRKSERIA